MDILFTSMELAPRRFPSGLQVVNIGYLPHKTYWVDQAFECYNFSLILKGRGHYCSGGRTTEIAAPCVITQAPGTEQSYGPDADGWVELYIVYDKGCLNTLQSRGLWPPPAAWWPVQSVDLFRSTTQHILDRMQLPQSIEQADYLDRLVEQCIVASLMPAAPHEAADTTLSKLQQLRQEIDTRLAQSVDWQACAASVHMSLSTFRRKWQDYVGAPPATYLTRRRMEEAARLLITSKLPIGTIAHQVGYDDALHFSRVFRQHYETAPRDYRKARG